MDKKSRKKKVYRIRYDRFYRVLVVFLFILFFLIVFKRITNGSRIVKEEVKLSDLDKMEENIRKDLDVFKDTTMIMVGDALIHRSIYESSYNGTNYDFTNIMSRIKPIVKEYDLAYYNQETILGGTELGLSTYPRFNSPYEVGDAFRDAGFNMVSLANNHSLDRGKAAIKNSVNYWNKYKKDVLTAGMYLSEEERVEDRIYTVNGIKYTMLSYTTDTNGLSIPNGENYLVNVYSAAKARKDIERVRDKVDFLIVAMHWGVEYTNTPVDSQRTIANYLASLGVNLIIGTHPHVIEPVEYIGDTMVVYSLGNFVSSQNGSNNLTGLMLSISLKKVKGKNGKEKVSIKNPTARLIYTFYREGSKGRYDYMVYPYDQLDNSILDNYEYYYEKYMNIAIGSSNKIAKYPLNA